MSVGQGALGTRAQPAADRYDRATAALDPPLALVDSGAFDRNAADMTRRAAGHPIRVATKSLRCRFLIERALATPGYHGVMCYSLPEALWLHAAGTSDDLLVAYPTVDRQALRALAARDPARAHITIMVDSTGHLDLVDRALGRDHPEIRVCLDLDVSWRPLAHRPLVHIGTRRSPVHTPQQALALARAIAARPGFRLAGLMGYEGQVAGLADAPPGHPVKAQLIRFIQARSVRELNQRRAEAIRLIQDVTRLEFVNGGGTGSLESTARDPSVTELTAGSGLVGPTLFDAYTRFSPEPALLFALPVVRRPGPGIATLFAGGYVASGAGTADRLPRPGRHAGHADLRAARPGTRPAARRAGRPHRHQPDAGHRPGCPDCHRRRDLGTLYLLYFLADAAHYHDPQLGLLTLMALYAVALAITGGVCGTASDRSGRRKPFIVAAAIGCGTAAVILVVSPTWPAALVAAPLLGAGFGTYWAAAPAVLTAVLPAASDRAKDLGVINVAYSLPLVVAPVIAGAVLGLMHSYPSLFALAGLASLAAAATITRVRSVR